MANPFLRASELQTSRWEASFKGAEQTRFTNDWGALNLHPDQETRYALRELRARARDLRRNNDYASGLVKAFSDNIVGWNGIRLKPRIKDPAGDLRREVNWEIERAWKDWGEEYAAVDEIDSWLDLQRLIIETWVTDGEVFIRKWSGWQNPYRFAVQLIDADLLDETFDVPPDSRGIEIRQGVELDAYGRRLAYHFFKRHPAERLANRERVRVPADEIIHFFVRYRPGQTRGFSLFAPALTTLKHIDGMMEAELVASRTEAAKMGWITNNDPVAIAAYAQTLQAAAAKGKTPDAKKMKIAPALVHELAPGQGFIPFDPTHPNSAFGEFMKIALRGVSRGFAVSYLTATGDVGEANYSSMRAGLLPERDHWRILQVVSSWKVYRPTYRPFIAGGLLTGAIRLPSPVASDYYGVEWRGRGWKWVDPKNDVEAKEKEIALGISSRTRGAHEHGEDYEEIVEEIEDEEAFAEEHDVDVSVSRGKSQQPQQQSAEDESSPRKNGKSRIAAFLNGGTDGPHSS